MSVGDQMEGGSESGLELAWTFGFSSWIPGAVHDLYAVRANCLVAPSGLNAVVYNYVSGEQQLLVGHSTAIGAIAVSHDCSIIATAENMAHDDAMVIIWEAKTALPLAMLSEPRGVSSIGVSCNGCQIAILTVDEGRPTLRIWSWMQSTSFETPFDEASASPMQYVRYSRQTDSELVVTGPSIVAFVTVSMEPPSIDVELRWIPQSIASARPIGDLTHSVHTHLRSEILTGTTSGTIVVWGVRFGETRRSFVKAVPLSSDASVTWLDVLDGLIAVGSADHALRFLDLQFRLVLWFEDFAYGPINSISFSDNKVESPMSGNGSVVIPEFIMATTDANIVKLTAKAIVSLPKPGTPRGFLLVKGFGDPISCIAAHSSDPVFAVTTSRGAFQLIDYIDRTIQFAKQFPLGSRVCAMAFSTSPPVVLAMAISDNIGRGKIEICSPTGRMQQLAALPITGSNGTMHVLRFSPCDTFLAMASSEPLAPAEGTQPIIAATEKHYVYVFTLADSEWVYVGRSEFHSESILQLEFSASSMRAGRCTCLLSLSRDRSLVDFDLEASSVSDGLRRRGTSMVELGPGRPVSMALMASSLVVSSSSGKVRTLVQRRSDHSWVCVRTTRAACNDGECGQVLIPLNQPNPRLMAYVSDSKFVGLMELPPQLHRYTAVVGHGGTIRGAVAGHDGRTLLSCDASFQCVNLWHVDADRFLETLGLEAPSYDMDDVIPVRSVLARAMLERRELMGREELGTLIAYDQVVTAMRALGYFPSEADIAHLHRELHWTKDPSQASLQVSTNTPPVGGMLTLTAFIDLFLNHRPIRDDPDREAITGAFAQLGADPLNLDTLGALLDQAGDRMSQAELHGCLSLIRPRVDPAELSKHIITPESFVHELLDLNLTDG